MSKSPRSLQELMTAVDAGHAVDGASSDGRNKLLGPRRRRRSTYYDGRGSGGARKSAPAVVQAPSSDTSFEFTTGAVSYSSASPASMVFSDGQLRAHQFPAVRSSADSSQATSSPVRSSSTGSSSCSSASSTKQQAAGMMTGSKKRVRFATECADKAAAPGKSGGGQQGMKKSGGLLGCMASACGPSSRNEAVEPVARNHNRKVVVAAV